MEKDYCRWDAAEDGQTEDSLDGCVWDERAYDWLETREYIDELARREGWIEEELY